jgi:hypothetical protein
MHWKRKKMKEKISRRTPRFCDIATGTKTISYHQSNELNRDIWTRDEFLEHVSAESFTWKCLRDIESWYGRGEVGRRDFALLENFHDL